MNKPIFYIIYKDIYSFIRHLLYLIYYKAIYNKKFLFFSSIILGYLTWFYASNNLLYTRQITVPIYFYNYNEQINNQNIKAPENITLLIKGFRSDIFNLNKEDIGIYIDAAKLYKGANSIVIQDKINFLSSSTHVIKQKPKTLSVTVV